MALPLERMQRWFQSVVVHPDEVGAAVRDPRVRRALAGGDITDVLLPSRTMSPAERIAVYQGMYPLRMHDALESDYPAVKHFLGDERFRRLVEAYTAVHPSKAYTLNRLGDHFPTFIEKRSGLRASAFLADLARLELAVSEAFDAEETPALRAEQIASVPEAAWPRARLVPVASLRVLALRHRANAYLESVRDDSHDHPSRRRHETWVAVWRREYAMYRLDLVRPAHDLLKALAAGRPLGRAVAGVLKAPGGRRVSQDEVFRWFREWSTGGVFRAVEVDGKRIEGAAGGGPGRTRAR